MMKSKEITITSIIASLYAITVITLPSISFLVFQVRIADSLIPLSMVIGWPAVLGVTIGCLVSNFFAPWGELILITIDSLFGSLANLIAGYISWKIYERARTRIRNSIALQLGCLIESILITLIVGTYLKYLLKFAFSVEIPILVSWSGVLIGSLISINVLGYSIVLITSRVLFTKHS